MTHHRQILYVVRPITMTSTCFLEPVTSLGHLSLLHLGDESVLCTLTCVFPHYCQHFPQSLTATSSVLLVTSQVLSSPLGFLHLFLCLHLCISASTSCICILHLCSASPLLCSKPFQVKPKSQVTAYRISLHF